MITTSKYMRGGVAALFVVSFLLSAPLSMGATAKAIFPDGTRSQPQPVGIKPNISHNIQDSGTVAPDITPQPETPTPIETPAAPTPPSSHLALILWIVGILVILGAIIALARKKKVMDIQ